MEQLSLVVTGNGTVAGTPAGINCSGGCTLSLTSGTTVDLMATAASGWSFAGFSGACTGSTCQVTLASNASVTALFTQNPPPQEQLNLAISGSGTVTSSPAGISCPSTCTASFVAGTSVDLTASAASGWSFTGFSEACTGANCLLSLNGNASVSAVFTQNPPPPQETLRVAVTGSGTVASSPGGISCPGSCTASFDQGSTVDLAATAASGWSFGGFSGGCTGATCDLTLGSNASVSATFTQNPPPPPVQVLTQRYDNGRDGLNSNETVLTPANVNVNSFGKIASYPLDDEAYAQPLYVSGLSIGGKTMDVVFVATENDTVYAFDASGQMSGPLWQRSFIDPSNSIIPVPDTEVSGITGTPVIDLGSNTMYVVMLTDENGVYIQRLHALDLSTGQDKLGGPVVIAANASGVTLDPTQEFNRSSLLLANGTVYFAEGGLEPPGGTETNTFHGWVLAYDATTLQQLWSWTPTPDGEDGGIWMAGCGLAADAAGYVYGSTGNGTYNLSTGGSSYGDSVVKLSSTGIVADYFTPYDQQTLNAYDLDLASGGVMLIPGTTLATTVGKDGSIYVADTSNLGHYNSGGNSQIVQYLPNAVGNSGVENSYSTPAFYNGYVYYSGQNDVLKQYQLQSGKLSAAPIAVSSSTFVKFGMQPSVSANGNQDGIVWATEDVYNSSGAQVNGILHAFDANNVGTELYNSAQNAPRDSYGKGVRFTLPTVARGRVFVVSRSQLAIFGLLAP